MAVETEYRLEESRTVTLDANGEATATPLGPTRPSERWVIDLTSVTATGNCHFQSFRGTEPVSNRQIDYTEQGLGDSSDTVIKLAAGEVVSFKWTRGSAGTVATVKVEGSRFVPGRRAY